MSLNISDKFFWEKMEKEQKTENQDTRFHKENQQVPFIPFPFWLVLSLILSHPIRERLMRKKYLIGSGNGWTQSDSVPSSTPHTSNTPHTTKSE